MPLGAKRGDHQRAAFLFFFRGTSFWSADGLSFGAGELAGVIESCLFYQGQALCAPDRDALSILSARPRSLREYGLLLQIHPCTPAFSKPKRCLWPRRTSLAYLGLPPSNRAAWPRRAGIKGPNQLVSRRWIALQSCLPCDWCL